MKKWEKEILKNKIQDESAVLWRLEKMYQFALEDVKQKVQVLQAKPQIESVVYQLKYQKELEKQLQAVYDSLYTKYYGTVDEYLKECYEDSFFSTMYSLHNEGIPVIIPFPQEEIAQITAVSADGMKLSDKIYQNTSNLARISREEISRGLATGSSYIDIANSLERRSEANYNQAKRIVVTEGHRVQEEVQFKTIMKAKEKGADVVKQWDSTLDSRTRKTHVELDGQLREVDQPFKIPSTGATAQFPGGFGIAKEDINCRCVSLQRARWALDKSEVTKAVGDLDGLSDVQLQELADRLGVSVDELIEKSNGVIESDGSINHYIKAKNYNDFKKKYTKKAAQQTAKQAAQAQVAAQSAVDPLADAYTPERKAKAKNFTSRTKADKFHRDYLDKEVWDKLSDREKYAVWEYTQNSNPMNKSLSGYHDTWDRYNFLGLDKTKWGYEDSWRYIPREFSKFGKNGRVTYHRAISDLTKAIDKAELPDDVFLVRGSGNGGLAGLMEEIIPFDDALDYLNRGDIDSLKKILEGSTIKNHAFTSTGIASGTGFPGDVKYKIYAPKGTKGIYAEPQSYYGNTVGMNPKLYQTGQSYYSVGDEAEVILQRGTAYRVTSINKVGYNSYEVEMEVVNQPDYFKYGDEDTFNDGATRHKD